MDELDGLSDLDKHYGVLLRPRVCTPTRAMVVSASINVPPGRAWFGAPDHPGRTWVPDGGLSSHAFLQQLATSVPGEGSERILTALHREAEQPSVYSMSVV